MEKCEHEFYYKDFGNCPDCTSAERDDLRARNEELVAALEKSGCAGGNVAIIQHGTVRYETACQQNTAAGATLCWVCAALSKNRGT